MFNYMLMIAFSGMASVLARGQPICPEAEGPRLLLGHYGFNQQDISALLGHYWIQLAIDL